MSKDVNLNPKVWLAKAKKNLPRLVKHAPFMAIIIILLVYVFVVLRVSQYATAEPSDAEEVTAASIPKVDKKAIEQIQSLAQSNAEVKSFFDAARQNPFQE